MSRNRHFLLHDSLATSYAPSAERSSEGDILFGLREDDANLRLGGLREDDANLKLGVSAYDLEGLREDDANLRLGDTKWDGATGRAEGSAEGHRDAQLGVSAYDLQPEVLASDGRVGGIVEDHWNIRMGVSAYDMEGLREDDANLRLGVSAYDLDGLREDDANVRLGGLREDDAGVRLGTSYAPDAQGAAEGNQSWWDLGISAYDELGVSAYDVLGDVDSLNAEAAAIEQEQMSADVEIGRKKGWQLRMTAHHAARAALKAAKKGTITSRAEADEFVRARTAKRAEEIKRELNTYLAQVDEVARDAVAKALEKYGAEIDKALSRKVSVQGLRMGYILRGLREDDANIRLGVSAYDELGRRRAFPPRYHMRFRKRMLRGAEEYPPEMLAAEGFHERFPVRVDIAGLGTIRGTVHGSKLNGLFDFLKPKPSAEEYIGKIRLVLDGWRVVKPQLEALPEASRKSIIAQMTALNNEPGKYETLNGFLAEGYAGYTDGRYDRVKRLEAYLPTVQKMVSEARALGGTFTIEQANKVASEDLKVRQEAAGRETFLEKAAPVAGAIGAAGLLTALVISMA